MTLEQYVKECPKPKIKIGCTNATGYFWGGKVKELDLDALNVSMYAGIAEKAREFIIKFAFANKDNNRKLNLASARKYLKRLDDFKTLKKREVVETRTSIAEKDVAIAIVTGNDTGDLWTIDPCGKIEIKSESGAKALASAIYNIGAKKLVHALRTVVCESEYFGMDPYGVLTDPAGIVHACELKAGVFKQIKAVVKPANHRASYQLVNNGYDGFTEIVGKYVAIDEVDEETAVIYNPIAQSEGEDLNCQVAGRLYYGTVIFAEMDKTGHFVNATRYPQIVPKKDINLGG